MEQMPREILRMFFGYLPLENWLSIMLVCKHWHSIWRMDNAETTFINSIKQNLIKIDSDYDDTFVVSKTTKKSYIAGLRTAVMIKRFESKEYLDSFYETINALKDFCVLWQHQEDVSNLNGSLTKLFAFRKKIREKDNDAALKSRLSEFHKYPKVVIFFNHCLATTNNADEILTQRNQSEINTALSVFTNIQLLDMLATFINPKHLTTSTLTSTVAAVTNAKKAESNSKAKETFDKRFFFAAALIFFCCAFFFLVGIMATISVIQSLPNSPDLFSLLVGIIGNILGLVCTTALILGCAYVWCGGANPKSKLSLGYTKGYIEQEHKKRRSSMSGSEGDDKVVLNETTPLLGEQTEDPHPNSLARVFPSPASGRGLG